MASKPYRLDSGFDLYAIRGLVGCFNLLVDKAAHESMLIDTGLIGELPFLSNALKSAGLGWKDIKAILLTHGHLDHTAHLARLKELTGAPLLAHPMEQPHIDGTFPYRGASRLCGALEAFGRWVLCYKSVPIDEPLSAGMELPYWGGLKVIHLPGHTQGHCGFYSQRFDLLFTGDLFASYGFNTHLPPFFLNSCPEKFDISLDRVTALSPKRLIPNHYFWLNGEFHRRKFDALVRKRKK